MSRDEGVLSGRSWGEQEEVFTLQRDARLPILVLIALGALPGLRAFTEQTSRRAPVDRRTSPT